MCCTVLTQMSLLNKKIADPWLCINFFQSSVKESSPCPKSYRKFHLLLQRYMTAKSENWLSFLVFFLPVDDATRPAEIVIKHIRHAIKATSQHSSSHKFHISTHSLKQSVVILFALCSNSTCHHCSKYITSTLAHYFCLSAVRELVTNQ